MLKGTAKAHAVDLLTLNTLRGTKIAFLSPKRYHEYTCPFYIGVSTPGYYMHLADARLLWLQYSIAKLSLFMGN